LRAVARVHEFRQTHNDIKLENILVKKNQANHIERVVLADFELVTAMSSAATRSGFTSGVGGTEPYQAPERYGGKAGVAPTEKSDMYSVGVVMLLCFASEHIIDAQKSTAPSSPQVSERDKWQTHWTTVLRVTMVRAQRRMGDTVSQMPQEVFKLCQELLDRHPAQRPSARQALTGDRYFNRASSGTPVYWKQASTEHVRKDLCEVPSDSATMQALREALRPQTPNQLGVGRDGHQAAYWMQLGLHDPSERSISIVKAWRVQSQNLHKKYKTAVETMADDISCGPPLQQERPPVCSRAKIMAGPGWPDSPNGCSRGGMALEKCAKAGFDADGEDVARQDVNEAFMLHGLPHYQLEPVVQKGFNQNYSGSTAGTMFGSGCYFTQVRYCVYTVCRPITNACVPSLLLIIGH
jgi:serine/threonine protein kinase